jgi:regulator of protease activity HflC (stomatin/prohibitin superfamily)
VDTLVPLVIIAILLVLVLAPSIRLIPEGRAGIVERFGRYSRTLLPGLGFLVPFVEKLRRPLVDMREQVITVREPAFTQDDVEVHPDAVVHFQVTDARSATYEIADYARTIEFLTVMMLRNVIGGVDLERARTARAGISIEVGALMDEEANKWGVRIKRVELRAIDTAETR